MSNRTFLVKQNLLKSLKQCGGYLLLQEHLFDQSKLLTPSLYRTEFEQVLYDAEAQKLATPVRTERGTKWKLSPEGEAWLTENA